jgi:hypothetical protein
LKQKLTEAGLAKRKLEVSECFEEFLGLKLLSVLIIYFIFNGGGGVQFSIEVLIV